MKCHKCGYDSKFIICPCGWLQSWVKPELYKWAIPEDYAYDISSVMDSDIITFTGRPGAGKTHLAMALGKYYQWKSGLSVRVLKCQCEPKYPIESVDEWRGSLNTGVLIMDEITDSKEVYNIIDYRVEKKLKTICTANRLPDSSRLISRLYVSGRIDFTGKDMRENTNIVETVIKVRKEQYADWEKMLPKLNSIKKAEIESRNAELLSLFRKGLIRVEKLPSDVIIELQRERKMKRGSNDL